MKSATHGLVTFLIISILGVAAQGQINTDSSNLYRFGLGSCQSQGSWTAAAIAQTGAIRTVIQSIANDKNCTGIVQALAPDVDSVEKLIDVAKDTRGQTQDSDNSQFFTQSVYGEAADHNMSSSKPNPTLMSTLMDSAVKSSLYNTNANSFVGTHIENVGATVAAAGRSMNAAIDTYGRIASSLALPAYQQCVVGRPAIGNAILGAVIKLGAAFSASSNGYFDNWGATTAKVANLLRNEHIANTLKGGLSADLTASISCLLESTSQAYCSALDAQTLLDKVQLHGGQPGQRTFKKVVGIDSPLAGYYILVQHLPNVTEWIQKILLSAEPQWTEDGQRMATALDNVNNFLKSLWVMKGSFRADINTMNTSIDPGDLRGRRNALLNALVKLINNMNVSQSTDPTVVVGNTQQNFFTLSMQSYDIPFFLIGVPTPKEVVVNSLGTQTPFNLWISQNDFERYREQFKDPDALASTIYNNLEILMRIALTKASAYYRNRIIVNKEMVVNNTVAKMPYDTKESLRYIYLWLDNFENLLKTRGNKDNQEMIPSVRNTKYKIKAVIDSYAILDDIIDLSPSERRPEVLQPIIDKYNLKDINPDKDNGSLIITAAYERVLQAAYDQFDVLLQRDSFLTTILSTYIYADYVIKTRNHIGMDQYTDDLMMATGQNLMNLLTQVHGTAPNQVKQDLTNAQNVNKQNLLTFEQFFRDSLVTTLEQKNLTAHDVALTDNRLNLVIANRLFRDVMSGNSFSDNTWSAMWSAFKGLFVAAPLTELLDRKSIRPDLYPFNFGRDQTIYARGDTGHHDFANMRDILCIQSLAFEDRKLFTDFCTDRDPNTGKRVGITLRSPLISDKETRPELLALNASWDAYMYRGMANQKVTDQSICAFRDFNRRGLVYWLTEDLKQLPNPEISSDLPSNPNPQWNSMMQPISNPPFQPTRQALDPHIDQPTQVTR